MRHKLTIRDDGLENPVYLPVPPVTEHEVFSLERILTNRLPEDYRVFLKTESCGQIDSIENFSFDAKKGNASLEGFIFDNLYHINEKFINMIRSPSKGHDLANSMLSLWYWARLWEKKEWFCSDAAFYYKFFPSEIFQIGSSGSAQIFIGIHGDRYGKIYVWNPMDDGWAKVEASDPPELLDPYECIYFVADSFDEFFSSLKLME